MSLSSSLRASNRKERSYSRGSSSCKTGRSNHRRSRSRSPVGQAKRKYISNDGSRIPDDKFQRRILYLLAEIRDLLKKDHMKNIQEYHFDKIDNLTDFMTRDRKLGDEEERLACKKYVIQIGGKDGKDHLKKTVQRCLTNRAMSYMNMKGKKNKFAFAESNLFQIIRDAVLATHQDYTESMPLEDCARFLKYAPERTGGVSRKN